MKKKIAIAALICAPFFGFAQTAAELVNKHIAAVGGEEKLAQIKSYTLKKSYKANATTDFDEEVNVVVDGNKFSRKKTLLGRDFFYVLNDKSGWLKIPMGSRDKAPTYTTKDLSSTERADLATEISDGLYAFQNFESKGYKNNGIVTSAIVNGVDCNNFTIEKAKVKKTYFFDKATGLLKREVTEDNGVTTTIDHNKYAQTAEGLSYPSESSYINSKDKKNTALTSNLVTNKVIADAVFAK